ncbi:hypothetical protein [Ureibacillus acetophenoni]|uniref:Uncharacterized protein n=1 Tax=Ureibacillus acetophenoni TaxID=614649 RepID=A0A285UEW9_9BACL|nr:hypothetical protein [Ureibacillus acetophenoni]SOC39928.1 hypothetical protein SAMN05877842_106192 [Ureibacillus acetophenoni]
MNMHLGHFARLGMPQLFEEHSLTKWYRKDIHFAIERYVKKYFHPDMVRVSKEEAYPG